jgi:hypothetical protein
MRATRAAAAAAAPRAGPAIAGLVHLRSRVPKSAQADERLLQTAKALAADSRAARAEHEAHADRLAKGFDEAQKQVSAIFLYRQRLLDYTRLTVGTRISQPAPLTGC